MIEDHDEWMADIRRRVMDGLHRGVALGWYEDVDEEARLPVRVVKVADMANEFGEHVTWAHAWMKMTDKFPSMKEAKRAGLGIPLEPGTKRFGTYMVRAE